MFQLTVNSKQLAVNSQQSTIRTPLYLLLNTHDFEKVTKVTGFAFFCRGGIFSARRPFLFRAEDIWLRRFAIRPYSFSKR
jgi:hypothetical protein